MASILWLLVFPISVIGFSYTRNIEDGLTLATFDNLVLTKDVFSECTLSPVKINCSDGAFGFLISDDIKLCNPGASICYNRLGVNPELCLKRGDPSELVKLHIISIDGVDLNHTLDLVPQFVDCVFVGTNVKQMDKMLYKMTRSKFLIAEHYEDWCKEIDDGIMTAISTKCPGFKLVLIRFTVFMAISMIVLYATHLFIRVVKFLNKNYCDKKPTTPLNNREVRYSAAGNLVSFMVLLFGVPLCLGCEIIPFLHSNINLCDQVNVTECNSTSMASLSFTSLGQIACIGIENDVTLSVKLSTESFDCVESTQYYVPKGEIAISESWNCDGSNGCSDGFRHDSWNEITLPHSGGLFHGCSISNIISKQCHTLSFDMSEMEMCQLMKCSEVIMKTCFEISMGKSDKKKHCLDTNTWTMIEPDIYAMVLHDDSLHRSVYSHLKCSSDRYLVIPNEKNVHDRSLVGSIQCSGPMVNDMCHFDKNDFYYYDFEGDLKFRTDMTYSSQLLKSSGDLDNKLNYNVNGFSYINLRLAISKKNITSMHTTPSVPITNLSITGYSNFKSGATIHYNCGSKTPNHVIHCPLNFGCVLPCPSSGYKMMVVTAPYFGSYKQILCKSNNIGAHAIVRMSINMSLPIVDLLQFTEVDGEFSSDSYKMSGDYFDFLSLNKYYLVICGFIAFIILMKVL